MGSSPNLVEEFESEEPSSRGGCGVAATVSINGEDRRDVVEMALEAGRRMEHRGGSIGDRADGAGIMMRPARAFFEQFIEGGRSFPDDEELIVGNVWLLPGMGGDTLRILGDVKDGITSGGFKPVGWRKVPVEEDRLPTAVKESMPDMWQVLMGRGLIPEDDVDREMYLLRNKMGGALRDVYLPSFVRGTTVYKTLCKFDQLSQVFPDLRDPSFTSSAALVHRRYSTNTVPKHLLVQPFSRLAHNGEINTNRANVNAVEDFERAVRLFFKVLMRQGSDSANLDRMVEFFGANGISLSETLRRFMMPPWRDSLDLDDDVRAYYEGVRRALSNLAVMEGPAAVVAMDGNEVDMVLDKMGLRPMRYMETLDGLLLISSELGACPVDYERISRTGQLNPGELLVADRRKGRVFYPGEVERRIVDETPINFRQLSSSKILVPGASADRYEFRGRLDDRLNYFGWNRDRKTAVLNMIKQGKEPISSMGHGLPLAVLSADRPTLFKFFKQIVAVVTNPSIDPIREEGAFDFTTYLGRRPGISEVRHDYRVYPQYKLESPFVTDSELAGIVDRSVQPDSPKVARIDMLFEKGDPENIKKGLASLRDQVLKLVKTKQAQIIVLSDRNANGDTLPLPSLLAVSVVNKALRESGMRRNVSLLVDTGEVQEAHDSAVLFAHGADAVNPYMMWHIAYSQGKDGERDSASVSTLRKVLETGLRRIMSKMGITTLDGYRDSQLFEAIGIDPSITAYYLDGTQSHVGGIGLDEIYEDICARAMGTTGLAQSRDKSAYRKDVYKALQQVARGDDEDAYCKFLEELSRTPPTYLRDLLGFREVEKTVPLEEVADEREIISSVFRGAAMSHGALNKWAHMAIARAFNSFGSSSNSGEGGEMKSRNKGGEDEEARSHIRQVASGRFGVDAEYLMNADEIQVKIGQGAKPGEGGHLPADKVNVEIATIRRTKEGVSLISPPPHHSIYSIEDLAQLVYNLRQVNNSARISVKVPAVTNLGTIAIGIVKAGADVIEISGFDGGTGAASSSSIEHAGIPLERSLAEVHQVLTENGVREWVKLRADSGIKSGMDIAKLMALGADEASFGSALMVAEMCVMCKGCSKGTCPAGITTQDGRYMANFMHTDDASDSDGPDFHERCLQAEKGIKNYLMGVSSEFRGILAKLGIDRPELLRGRVDLLRQIESDNPRHNSLDLSSLLKNVSVFSDNELPLSIRDNTQCRLEQTLGNSSSSIMTSRIAQGHTTVDLDVEVMDRAIGARLAGKIASGEVRVPDGGFTINLSGYAGQALGFAAVSGMKISLTGYANDSVGEAMSGSAKLIVKQPVQIKGERSKNSVIGNAACYGATGGTLYVEGTAGQRLGVRNSGALIVTEGAGKYAFEYMTGGLGVVLGEIKEVVGAGMTGGALYCMDNDIQRKIHKESVSVSDLSGEDFDELHAVIADYFSETRSPAAENILARWDDAKYLFKKVIPRAAA